MVEDRQGKSRGEERLSKMLLFTKYCAHVLTRRRRKHRKMCTSLPGQQQHEPRSQRLILGELFIFSVQLTTIKRRLATLSG